MSLKRALLIKPWKNFISLFAYQSLTSNIVRKNFLSLKLDLKKCNSFSTYSTLVLVITNNFLTPYIIAGTEYTEYITDSKSQRNSESFSDMQTFWTATSKFLG